MQKYRIMQDADGKYYVEYRIIFTWIKLNVYGSVRTNVSTAKFITIEDAEFFIEKCKEFQNYPREIKRL